MDAAQRLIDYIQKSYLSPKEALAPSTSLFRDGLLDSMKLVELISFVEESFSVRVSPMDITIENFDTVDNIVGLIGRKGNANA